jgi:hypothetical protein
VPRKFGQKDVHELRLPRLRGKQLGKKFFYYFEKEVGHDVFQKLFPLTPFKRASLVKMVELF